MVLATVALGPSTRAAESLSGLFQSPPNAKLGSAGLPLDYHGPGLVDPKAPDGHLMYSPGVQNIEISRANRSHPPDLPPAETEKPKGWTQLGWTYQHHIGIGCWKGELYAVWDMTHVDEDVPPTHVVYSTSSDGFHWSAPKDLFPYGVAFNLRFYFYHASNGRMLVFAAAAYSTHQMAERDKTTLLVREVKFDHTLGKVYTLIKPGPRDPPVYTESPDAGFVAACREAYNNKPLLEQQDYGVLLGKRGMKWHQGKYWPTGKVGGLDNFWTFGKALCFFHRKDGELVGLCKDGFVTLSADNGQTWSPPIVPPGLVAGNGKVWAQRTPDGRYAMVYTPQRPSPRYPMVVTTSDDGILFHNMRLIHGEVPPERYEGEAKGMGPQYIRGVCEWGGDAPTIDPSAIWVIYSVNKEDIWVSRIPVPIQTGVTQPIHDTFDQDSVGPRVPGWNTYSPVWAPVSIVGEGSNHYLELEDREPVDYARAVRVFPVNQAVDVSFKLEAQQADRGRLEIELLGEHDQRPVRIVLNDRGKIEGVDGRRPAVKADVPGLTGVYFHNADFSDPDENADTISKLDDDWGNSANEDKRMSRHWSARWRGWIKGPADGEVEFRAQVNDGLRLKIGGQTVIDGLDKNGPRAGKVMMRQGLKLPITLEFTSSERKAALHLSWAWAGHPETIVPASAISHETAPELEPVDLAPYQPGVWQNVSIHADCAAGTYSLALNGKEVLKNAKFAEGAAELYALSLRTGKFRGSVSPKPKTDLPKTEEPVEPSIYRIDEVTTGKAYMGSQEPGFRAETLAVVKRNAGRPDEIK